MNWAILESLQRHASTMATLHAPALSRLRACNWEQIRVSLHDIACLAHAGLAKMSDEELKYILPALFDLDAIALLDRMPNEYFFWETIRRACLKFGFNHPSALRVSRTDIQLAVQDMRRELAVDFDLRLRLADLTVPAQIAARAAVGLVLVQCEGFECHNAVDNLILTEPTFYEFG